ncbi:hypothetical protein C7N83_13000 [Neisseria iguanae]|uniref:Transposase IS4-like domain-containing protein n=2 Tax=Neisseria iguanae TaxID=90242 RepID=A0A2P7TX45_9NEIS|nr:hypothetical protein C7N83_13000 [Neisseria iguanae]
MGAGLCQFFVLDRFGLLVISLYIGKLHISPANGHGCNHLEPRLSGIVQGTDVYADKGYDGKADRVLLQSKKFSDGMMRKAHRDCPLTEEDQGRNKQLSETRYGGTVFRNATPTFRYSRASYFRLLKAAAQSHLKAICANLLKQATVLIFPKLSDYNK